jgi:hypothetical protein
MCERRLGKHKESLDRLMKLLQQNNKLLEAQRQAAYTYQEWAAKDAGYYLNAMLGGRRNTATNQNIFWGWHTLSVMVQRHPSKDLSEGVFHEARYNLAECRYRHAMAQSPAEKLEKLKLAQQDIAVTYRLRPSLGGPEREKKYDKLLQDIQKALGQKPTGLSGLDSVKPAGTPTASTK